MTHKLAQDAQAGGFTMGKLTNSLGVALSWINKSPQKTSNGEKIQKIRFAVSMRDFDPIHLWHLQVAQCAWDEHGLDYVLFVLRGGLLVENGGFDPEMRYRMVKAAVRKIPQFRASRFHIDH